MNPAIRIASLYRSGGPKTFADDVQAHMLGGYLFVTPELFLACRPVPSGAAPSMIRDPWQQFDPADCDTWFIYAAATAEPKSPLGLVKTCLTKMPFPLPLAAWERTAKGRTAIKFFSIARLVAVLSTP